ncbi:hypothetical protein LQZ18_01205 [Lachnospiraceae bacterium ZAX-1]
MKKTLMKSTLREITGTMTRFLSIFSIAAIGVGLFSGLRSTAPDMRLTGDKYFDENNLMDFRLVSTFGFDEKDVEAAKSVSGEKTVYPAYYMDAVVEGENGDAVARVMSLPGRSENTPLNHLDIKEGRLPENANECLVCASAFGAEFALGNEIVLVSDDEEDELSDTLKNSTYTIVGLFDSPMYVEKDRFGSTTVGSGSIDVIVYVPKENFTIDYYTEIFLSFDALTPLQSYSDKYEELSKKIETELLSIADKRELSRYQEIVDDANVEIEDAQTELFDARKETEEELLSAKTELFDAQKELADAKVELDDAKEKLADAKPQLAKGERELEEAKMQLADGEAQYANSLTEAKKGFADGEAELVANREKLVAAQIDYDAGVKEYESGLAAYEDGRSKYEKGFAQYNEGTAALKEGRAQYDAAYAEFEAGYALYESKYAEFLEREKQYMAIKDTLDEATAQAMWEAMEAGRKELFVQKAQLDAAQVEFATQKARLDASDAALAEQKPLLDATKRQLDEANTKLKRANKELGAGKAKLDEGLAALKSGEIEFAAKRADAEKQLADARTELDRATAQLLDGQATLAKERRKYEDGVAEYEEGLEEFKKGTEEYEDGLAEYEDGKIEAEEKLAEAQGELDSAKRELLDLDNPKWYVFTRDDNIGYSEYGENADRIRNISQVFPLFFLLVAGLVCFITIQRMVEEQRQLIGTLKALGYGNISILFKYVFYALLSSVLGAAAGFLIGMKIFPIIVIHAYSMMYSIPGSVKPYDYATAGISVAVTAAVAVIAVLFVCREELWEHPAQLMRPKAPRKGKRVWLEKIPFIWNRTSFSLKVSIRNVFRYKRRMFMTIIGISGCTALLLTGFALFDSIGDIVNKQFDDIVQYTGLVAVEENLSNEEKAKIEQVFTENDSQMAYFYQKQFDLSANDKRFGAYLCVPEGNTQIGDYISLHERKGKKSIELGEQAVLTEKMAKLLGIKSGDELSVSLSETVTRPVAISGVTENYAYNYLYMKEERYVQLFGKKPEYNLIFFNNSLSNADNDLLATKLLSDSNILSVEFTHSMGGTFSEMMETLSAVIFVIILTAGALAFVVLYNLTNITIAERIREIATLKVLGFYDAEVDRYIFRENIFLTIIGDMAGLILGRFLAGFIIATAEINDVMFGRDIHPLSFLWAALITLGFAAIVAFFMHFHLKKVDMAQSLKSVE